MVESNLIIMTMDEASGPSVINIVQDSGGILLVFDYSYHLS